MTFAPTTCILCSLETSLSHVGEGLVTYSRLISDLASTYAQWPKPPPVVEQKNLDYPNTFCLQEFICIHCKNNCGKVVSITAKIGQHHLAEAVVMLTYVVMLTTLPQISPLCFYSYNYTDTGFCRIFATRSLQCNHFQIWHFTIVYGLVWLVWSVLPLFYTHYS